MLEIWQGRQRDQRGSALHKQRLADFSGGAQASLGLRRQKKPIVY